jgi:hypothetical protein
LSELNVVDADASHEVEFVTRDIDVGALAVLDRDKGGCEIRTTDRRFGGIGDVEETLHLREWGRAVEFGPHRTAPYLQGGLDRPGCDALDEDGSGVGAGYRCGPAARKAKEDRAVHLIGLNRRGSTRDARYTQDRGDRRASQHVLQVTYSFYHVISLRNNIYESKSI